MTTWLGPRMRVFEVRRAIVASLACEVLSEHAAEDSGCRLKRKLTDAYRAPSPHFLTCR